MGNIVFTEKGVRQGGILSPFLFKLYIDGIINEIAALDLGCILSTEKVNNVAYADDKVLLSRSVENMELMYSLFFAQLHSNNPNINKSKTKCMMFGSSNRQHVTICNDKFDIVNYYKYLGLMVTSDLQDNNDIENTLQLFYTIVISNFCRF